MFLERIFVTTGTSRSADPARPSPIGHTSSPTPLTRPVPDGIGRLVPLAGERVASNTHPCSESSRVAGCFQGGKQRVGPNTAEKPADRYLLANRPTAAPGRDPATNRSNHRLRGRALKTRQPEHVTM